MRIVGRRTKESGRRVSFCTPQRILRYRSFMFQQDWCLLEYFYKCTFGKLLLFFRREFRPLIGNAAEEIRIPSVEFRATIPPPFAPFGDLIKGGYSCSGMVQIIIGDA